MLVQRIESTGVEQIDSRLRNPVLTPIGERLSRGDTILYEEFFQAALPPQSRVLSAICTDFISELMTELDQLQSQHGVDVKKSFRGSTVRRASWRLTENRNGYPVGDYWNINQWWRSYFSTHASSDSDGAIEQAVQKMLINGPNDLDIRLEYPKVENRLPSAQFAEDKLPKIMQRIFSKYPNLKQSHQKFIVGVDPFSDEDGYRFTTYIGNIYQIYNYLEQYPLLTIDLGITNVHRNTVYAAHNYGELCLLFSKDGLSLPKEDFYQQLISHAFSPDKISWFTPMHGLKNTDIIVRGSRQAYFGAFYDSGLPVFDQRTLDVIHHQKIKYIISDEKRMPEIAANFIVGLMADPMYAFDCLRLADYFRPFSRLNFLADDPQKQLQMQNAIERRMTSDYFIDGVWNPFMILDAYNEIGGNMERTFSGLVKLFTP